MVMSRTPYNIHKDVLTSALFGNLYVFYYTGFTWIGIVKYLFSVLVSIPALYGLTSTLRWFIRRYTSWEENS